MCNEEKDKTIFDNDRPIAIGTVTAPQRHLFVDINPCASALSLSLGGSRAVGHGPEPSRGQSSTSEKATRAPHGRMLRAPA
ncbi:hypothetical protein MAPG_09329 [Magnaporthiopsis poae ATCC 64411]|uniref:Uncharacterized protein n=1 Tax=Magnaporthiopsis poae (strain ATCC 64411 / 73-15) TaxID=644358 RepID=A0A0C4E9N3_MAGP6|nr:hypothetical protein MAPG_09329 [Magnaporthiopsis poae ATCC 64411]